MDRVIEVEHLRKSYGEVVAVADVSFSVRRGEIFGLLGPNGAGKSTTVECLEGLLQSPLGRLANPHAVMGAGRKSGQSFCRPLRWTAAASAGGAGFGQ